MKNNDIETLRILFGATIGELCNQERWNDAKEMEGIKDRLIQALESQSEDAISRQAAIDLIADYDLSMGQVVRSIHALPSVNPQPKMGHWIPVSERSPEDHKNVLICLSSDQICIGCYNSHRLPFSNNVIGWGASYVHKWCSNDVIAWMPLPEPYKAESEK